MGNSDSKPISTEGLNKIDLKKDTEFRNDDAMVDRLLQIYQQLQESFLKGKLTPETFTELMGMSNPKIGNLIYETITKQKKSQEFITPDVFIQGLNIFHPNADRNKLITVVFEMYTKDGKSELSKSDVEDIINISAENSDFMNLSKAKIKNLASQLFQDFNDDGNDTIDINEFRRMVNKAPGLIDSLRLNLAEIFPQK